MHADGVEIVLTNEGKGDVAVGDDGELLAVGRMYGKGIFAFDVDRLDVGQLAVAEGGKSHRREVAQRRTDNADGVVAVVVVVGH